MKINADILRKHKLVAAVIVAALLGVGIGYGLRGESPGTRQAMSPGLAVATVSEETARLTAPAPSGEKYLYACPMACIPPMQKPGQCPVCGMDLVGVLASEHRHEEGASVIRLSEESVRAAGIRVAPVEEKFVTAEIRLFGKIEYDPVEQYKVTAFAPGVIDRIYVKRAGQTVRAGDPLFDIHSSELFFLEQELFEVLKQFPDAVDYRPARGYRYRRLMRPPTRQFDVSKPGTQSGEEDPEKKAALQKLEQIKRKLLLLGLTKDDIENLITQGQPTGISTVTTPTTGIVQEQNAYKGAYVNTGETIFTIANPTYKWARLDAYESDYPWIRLGAAAEFQTYSFPGETFKGTVTYLDPEFDPRTRIFKVGVLYNDSEGKLKPNMLVRGVIRAKMTAAGVAASRSKRKETPPLVIPDTAPLITGTRAVVYVASADENGVYEAREIVLGPRARGYYVVKSGLHKGERVVVSGNFKIDSAVQILAQPSMMEPGGGQLPRGQHHGGAQQMDATGADGNNVQMEERVRPEATVVPRAMPMDSSGEKPVANYEHTGASGTMPMGAGSAPVENKRHLHDRNGKAKE